MLDYSEVKPHKFIVLEGVPYEVLGSHVFRKQQRKPVNDTKLRNLITGKVAEISFHQNEKVEEAELDTRTVKFMFMKEGRLPAGKQEYWFCEQNDPAKRFELSAYVIGEPGKFLKANMLVDLLEFQGKLLGVKLPIKAELKVTEAPPSIKGNTAQGGTKTVTLETGTQINAPLFVNENDVIVINTE